MWVVDVHLAQRARVGISKRSTASQANAASRWRTVVSKIAFSFVAAALCAAAATAAAKPKEPEYGPIPDWEQFKAQAEQAIRAQLVDPDSAKFSWPWHNRLGFYKPMLAKRVHGYTACGLVNSRNRMGGYAGDSYFVVVIDFGRVLYSEIAPPGSYTSLAESCQKVGFAPAAPPAPSRPSYGVAFVAVSNGLYVDRVLAGSVAEKAGMKPGMVIALINGIALKGMTTASAEQLLSNVTGKADVELVDGTHIMLERP